ncbi:hypothetical protein D3C86_2174720 [compost metagenome]
MHQQSIPVSVQLLDQGGDVLVHLQHQLRVVDLDTLDAIARQDGDGAADYSHSRSWPMASRAAGLSRL